MPITAQALAGRRVSAEGQEGLAAFVEKRPPRWVVTSTETARAKDRGR
jgi:methylglutaconyl-CoA hydratase